MIAHTARAFRLLPLAALFAAGGCFATRNDVRVVQSDLASFRTEQLKANADQREALSVAMRTLGVASDSVRAMNNRLTSLQGDVKGGLRAIDTQLIEIQSLLKQSASRLEQLRKDAEIRQNQITAPYVPPTGVPMTAADSAAMAAAAAAPQSGPKEMLADGRGQMARFSYSTARAIFQDLLTTYPAAEEAPDAQLYLAQTYEGEKQFAAALPAYAAVMAKYPESSAAPRALWKRAGIFESQGKISEAKRELEIIVSRYKTSDVFALAEEKLKNMK